MYFPLVNKGDLSGAENYYLGAIIADPEDGDILAQYAELVWKVHADRDKAKEYFERAIRAAPQDSKVLAAHASFLWEVDDDNSTCLSISKGQNNVALRAEELQKSSSESVNNQQQDVNSTIDADAACGGFVGFGGGNSGIDLVTGGGPGDENSSSPLEQYYKRMVTENPWSPLVHRNYAHFLYQSKVDLQGAEEYYSRALLMDQSDGELLSQYANLSWKLHGDKHKAQSYYERSVKTAPADSHVLAAYASFLWNTGKDEEEDDEEDQGIGLGLGIPQLPCVHIPIPTPHGILAAQGA